MNVEIENAVETLLRAICFFNYQSIVRLLLHREIEINVCEIFDDAFQIAIMKKHITIVKLIINENVNVNQQNDFYDTVLQVATYHDQHNAVKLLLDADVDVHVKKYFNDVFHAAIEREHQNVIMLMLRKNYKFCHSSENFRCRMKISRYKVLMRAAFSERNINSYKRKKSF